MTQEKKDQIAELQRRVDRMDEVVFQATVDMRTNGQQNAHCIDAAQAIRNALARAYERVKTAA